LLDSQGIKTTYLPNVAGVASSETGFENIRVEYEILSGGSGTRVANVGPLGEFCWEPTLTVLESGETNVSIRARAGRWNEATNATVWGAWTTSTFVYRAATESALLGWKDETSDRDDATYCERKISGSVAPGEGVVSYYVEFDVDGDGTADGRTTPNSQNDFAFYVKPLQSKIYARVVDELADGTSRVASQGWQTIATSCASDGAATETTLDLYFVDAVDYEPYLQVGNYYGTYSNLTISLDYDYDGTADASLAPDSLGQISRASIISALAKENVEIRDGFSIVYAWVGYPTANETAKVPVPLSTSDAASEVARFESFIASLATILDYDPTEAPGSSASASATSISREFDVQTTPEPAANSTATASLNVGAQSDWEVLRNSPIPEIAFPTLDGEAVDLSRDVALLQTLDDVADAYDAAVRAAQNAWTATYRTLRETYDATVDAAWNDYSREYSRNAAEFAELQAQSWESFAASQTIQTLYQREIDAINARNAARTAEIAAWYSAEVDSLVSYYNAHRYDEHNSACSGYSHTNACQLRELQERRRQEEGLARLGALRSQKELALNAETQLLTLQAQTRRDAASSDAKKTFEIERNDRLAELAQNAAELGKIYENAVANAIYDFYAGGSSNGLAGADETYRNAIATAAQTATTAAWSAVRSALTVWKNDASTPNDWGDYVNSLYDLSQTRALAEVAAYVAQVRTTAAAQKAADVAATTAYRDYLTSNATITCVAECENVASVQTLQNAVATATAANETATSELYSSELASQIETSLSTRFARIDEYLSNAATRSSRWYACATSLVGVNDSSVSSAAWSALNSALEELAKTDSIGRFAEEAALYDALIDSGETLQTEELELERDLQLALWSALGTYWKAEIATETERAIATENAENAYAAAFEAAEKTVLLASLAAESTAATAQIAAEQACLDGENALTQTTLQTLYDEYFTLLIAACGEMANDCVGDYYASAVGATQTAFNAQNAADSSFETSLISKAATFATASLGLETSLATSYINAIYDYYATQRDSTAAALRRMMASDQAEIDARVAYYVAVENANCAQNVAIVEANAESTRRKLNFLTAWGEYVVEVAWKLDNPDYDSYNYSYMNYYSTDLPTTLTATPTFGAWSNNVPTQFAQVPIVGADSAVEYDETTLWNAFRSLDASVVSMQTHDAQLRGEAERASAASSYVEAFTANYGAETRAALNDAGVELSAELAAETTLDDALWAAQGTALDGYLTAARAADATSNALDYINATVA
ncbi:MAG: hypothetical protein IJZ10_02625, partial [Thermoguttaceae bacterium]|nr:hypothetical protein [Thermoguttaceae bacterium]